MDDTIGAGAPAAFNPEVHAGSPVEPTDDTSLLFQVVNKDLIQKWYKIKLMLRVSFGSPYCRNVSNTSLIQYVLQYLSISTFKVIENIFTFFLIFITSFWFSFLKYQRLTFKCPFPQLNITECVTELDDGTSSLFFNRFWTLINRASFLKAMGQYCKLARS